MTCKSACGCAHTRTHAVTHNFPMIHPDAGQRHFPVPPTISPTVRPCMPTTRRIPPYAPPASRRRPARRRSRSHPRHIAKALCDGSGPAHLSRSRRSIRASASPHISLRPPVYLTTGPVRGPVPHTASTIVTRAPSLWGPPTGAGKCRTISGVGKGRGSGASRASADGNRAGFR